MNSTVGIPQLTSGDLKSLTKMSSTRRDKLLQMLNCSLKKLNLFCLEIDFLGYHKQTKTS